MRSRKIKKFVTVLILVISLLAVQTLELTVMASSTAPDLTNPSIIVSNFADLQDAVNTASDGTVIGIDSLIPVDSPNVTLGSEDGSKHVYIVRMNADSYLWLTQITNLTIFNITLDGNSSQITGNNPMLFVDGTLNLNNSVIQNCAGVPFGAVYVTENGMLSATATNFHNNNAISGGHIENYGTVTLNGCSLTNGSAQEAGGAVSNGYNMTIENCRIVGNHAGLIGGAIHNDEYLSISQSVIYGNTAIYGNDIANTINFTSFSNDDLADVMPLYEAEGVVPVEWIYDGPATEEELNQTGIFNASVYVPQSLMRLVLEGEETGGEEDGSDDTEDGGTSGDDTGTDDGTGDTEDSGNTENPDDTEDGGSTDGGDDTGDSDNQEDGGTGEDSGTMDDKDNTDSGNQDSSTDESGDNTDSGNQDDTTGDTGEDNTQNDASNDTSDSVSGGNVTNNYDESSTTTTTTTTEDNSSVSNTDTYEDKSSTTTTTTTTNNYYTYNTPQDSNTTEKTSGTKATNATNSTAVAEQKSETVSGNSTSESASVQLPDNLTLDLHGVDVSYEIVDGVPKIVISNDKVTEQIATEQITAEATQARVQEPMAENAINTASVSADTENTSASINWYEIVKMLLLAAILIVVIYKPSAKKGATTVAE